MKILNNDIFFPQVKSLISEGKEVEITPTGNSMLPFIRGGEDSVVLSAPDELNTGDILLALLPRQQQYVLHRLIKKDGHNLTLRGDGNIVGEEYCTESDIIAKVIAIKRPNGQKKHLSKARLWQRLYPFRRYLLKIYRKVISN